MYSKQPTFEKSLIDEVYELYIEHYKWSLYRADKCLWEQQGETVARERVEIYLKKIYEYED